MVSSNAETKQNRNSTVDENENEQNEKNEEKKIKNRKSANEGIQNDNSKNQETVLLKPLLRDEIHGCFREPFVVKGYRNSNLKPIDYVRSAFDLSFNETVNVWSHGLAFFLFLVKFIHLFNTTVSLRDARNYPLLTSAIGTCGFLLMSSVAHMFNCMSPIVRHICFFLDYTAIALYSVGAGQTAYFYCRPVNPELIALKSPLLWGLVSLCMSMVFTTLCCLSRTEVKWHRYKYVIRTVSIGVTLFVNTFPYLYRLATHSSPEDSVDAAFAILMKHYLFNILAGVANVTRFPERYIPGVFDCCGQSHHFLHLFTSLGALYQFDGVFLESQVRKDFLWAGDVQATFSNTIVVMAMAIILNLSIVLYCRSRAKRRALKSK